MLHFALTQTCHSIDYYDEIAVWGYIFYPRTYLIVEMENFINSELRNFSVYEQEKLIIRPSRLLQKVFIYIDVLESLSRYITIDVPRIIRTVLLQQSQMIDASGAETYTCHYINWYLEYFLHKLSMCKITCCPYEKSFIMSQCTNDMAPVFNPQEYADYTELRALVSLLGPYGVLHFKKRLASALAEILMFVLPNTDDICFEHFQNLALQFREVLRAVKCDFKNADKCKQLLTCYTIDCELCELTMHLKDFRLDPNEVKNKQVDICTNVLQRMCIIGEVIYFKALLQEALLEMLANESPVLIECVEDIKRETPCDHPDIMFHVILPDRIFQAIYEMCSATGMNCPVDTDVLAVAEKETQDVGEEDRLLNALTMTLMACSLVKIAAPDADTKTMLPGIYRNNYICVAKAVNTIVNVLFCKLGQSEIRKSLEEFLTTAISCTYNIREIAGPVAQKNPDVIYAILDQGVELNSTKPTGLAFKPRSGSLIALLRLINEYYPVGRKNDTTRCACHFYILHFVHFAFYKYGTRSR
ncbi:unnamed protein product [Soboliphyme baturini]|uniref:Transport and Golgi organization protein 6 homolog n=1 Tax=Soboliphyme baturini TaxID=241478 RepID=A0A183J2C9_9BILA|nr:unnamed protein product [Soboliphyme baturini]